MIDLSKLHSQRERGRIQAPGRRTDDLGAPGVRLTKAEMIALAEKILAGAR